MAGFQTSTEGQGAKDLVGPLLPDKMMELRWMP